MACAAELVGYDDATDRELYVVECDPLDALPPTVRVPSRHYVCLLAGDTTKLSDAAIHRVAAAVLGGGAVYVALWGRGAEWAHRLVDDAVLMHETSQAEDSIVMTSWHDESLDETLLYFLRDARPSTAYRESCRAGVVLALGPQPRSAIRHALVAPLEHVARLGR